jgi:hypothetical protein
VSNSALTAISVGEAVLLVLVLALALTEIRRRLEAIASGLNQLADGVTAVEQDLSLIGPTVPKVNAPLTDIVGALPSIAEMAEKVARR